MVYSSSTAETTAMANDKGHTRRVTVTHCLRTLPYNMVMIDQQSRYMFYSLSSLFMC